MAYTVTRESIASFADIEAQTTQDFSANQLVLGQNLLDRYQKEIETLLRRPLSVIVTEEPIRRSGAPGDPSLVVTRYRPVVSISAIYPTDMTYVITNGIVYLDYNLMYPLLDSTETISYRARIPEYEIDAIRSLMVDRAIRVMAKEEDDARGATSIGEAGYTANYLDEGWTEVERATLPPKKRIIL